MRFTVPQFIEHEAKIVGPLTFRQFIFVGIAGAFSFILYFNAPFLVFLITTVFLVSLSLVFAFVKVGGRNIFTILWNLLKFSLSPRMYLWRKRGQMEEVFEKVSARETKKTSPEESSLKIAEKSQLKKLQAEIETKK